MTIHDFLPGFLEKAPHTDFGTFTWPSKIRRAVRTSAAQGLPAAGEISVKINRDFA